MIVNFKPVGDRVLVKKPKQEEVKRASGIYVPPSATALAEFESVSVVEAVGDGVKGIKVGDKIKFENPHYLVHQEQEYYLINSRNILLLLN